VTAGRVIPPSKRRVFPVFLTSAVALLSAPFAPLLWGLPLAPCAVLMAVAVWRFQSRERPSPRIPLAVSLVGLLMCLGSSSMCGHLLTAKEVTGADAVRQEKTEDAFDVAFDKATAAPPSTSPSKKNPEGAIDALLSFPTPGPPR
jgi:hypothetical protein